MCDPLLVLALCQFGKYVTLYQVLKSADTDGDGSSSSVPGIVRDCVWVWRKTGAVTKH